MKQRYIHTFTGGNRVVCIIDTSALKQMAAHERLKNPADAIKRLTWEWDAPPTEALLPEYRAFAQRMYGKVAQAIGKRMLIRGPSEVSGIDEAWLFDEQGAVTVKPLPPEMQKPKPQLAEEAGFDIDEMQRLGRLSQRDAQSLHAHLCRTAGMKEEIEIEAAWNVQSPGALWNCPPDECKGPYVDELTGWVLRFMAEKVKEAHGNRASMSRMEKQSNPDLQP